MNKERTSISVVQMSLILHLTCEEVPVNNKNPQYEVDLQCLLASGLFGLAILWQAQHLVSCPIVALANPSDLLVVTEKIVVDKHFREHLDEHHGAEVGFHDRLSIVGMQIYDTLLSGSQNDRS